jgi:hypothetical protein
MRKLGLAVAVGILAAGTAAQAQVNVTGSSAGSDITFGSSDFHSFTGPASGVITSGSTSSGYASSISVDPTSITFSSGTGQSGQTAGPSVTGTSFTDLGIRVTNGGSAPADATLHSQITPASMGFYMANTANCGTTLQTCAQSQGLQTLSQLSHVGFSGAVGGASFQFSILQGDATLYNVSGSMTLNLNSDGFDGQVVTDVTQGQSALTNFHQVNFGNTGSAVGFTWDATDVPLDLGTINPDSSESLQYFLSVSSFTNGACLSDGVTCLVAYSSFGDPIGSAGAVTGAAPFFLSSFGGLAGSNVGPTFITGLDFGTVTVNTPTVDFNSGVPEPATWAMMVAGFGLLGAALRRRRVLAYN